MNYIDQKIIIDQATYESVTIEDSIWATLEDAAKETTLKGFSAMNELGALLGAALFPPDSNNFKLLLKNLAVAQHRDQILRLWFTGHAAKLPVEFITLPDELMQRCKAEDIVISDPALSLQPRVELLRALGEIEQDRPRIEVTESEPLRILIVAANPVVEGWPKIRRAEPQARIIEAACIGIGGKHVKVTLLPGCSIQSLKQALQEISPHILHFVGHGAKVTEDVGQPSLVLEPRGGQQAEYLSGQELLKICPSLPEVITLNACHLGRTDPLVTGLAETLTNAGVPLVLAMQLPVLDNFAEHIAEYIYRPLLKGLPVSQALALVRRRVAFDERLRHHPLFATPVLYSRVTETDRFTGIPAASIVEAHSRASTLRFVGREWLWKADVKTYLKSTNGKVCLLEAKAGMGKSSFLEYCRRNLEQDSEDVNPANGELPLLLSYHYHYGERAASAACARELAVQIASWLAENDRPIPDERPPKRSVSPYAHACEVLTDLISAVPGNINIILLLDALDEASELCDALPIAELLGKLPDNLAVLVTARPVWYTKWHRFHPGIMPVEDVQDDPRFALIRLDPLSEKNLQDVAYFLFVSFQPFDLTISQTACLELARYAKGNFLLADILCSLLFAGVSTKQVQHWFKEADSVTDAYALVFREIAAALAGDAGRQRNLSDTEDLLALLACSFGPFTEAQLHHLFAAREDSPAAEVTDAVAGAMSHLRRFLSSDLTDHGELRFNPYHPSLRHYGKRRLGIDTLDSAKNADLTIAKSAPRGPNESKLDDPQLVPERQLPRSVHAYRTLWADYCRQWRDLELYPRIYALRHLVPHLVELEGDGPIADIEKALTDYTYIAAALGADPSKPERPLDVNELIVHYESAEKRRLKI